MRSRDGFISHPITQPARILKIGSRSQKWTISKFPFSPRISVLCEAGRPSTSVFVICTEVSRTARMLTLFRSALGNKKAEVTLSLICQFEWKVRESESVKRSRSLLKRCPWQKALFSVENQKMNNFPQHLQVDVNTEPLCP